MFNGPWGLLNTLLCLLVISFPKEKSEIINLAKQFNRSMASKNTDDYPSEMKHLFNNVRVFKGLLGAIFHLLLHLLIKFFKLVNIWLIVGILSKLRIYTDSWSFEPRQCGYNTAYTNLGLSYLQSGNLTGAINALRESWQVYPCPHSTSFGLRTALAKNLSKHAEASSAVSDYRDIYNAFKA